MITETQRANLAKLAERCEAATGPTKALDREIALAVGWCRQSPSEAKRKNPAWFHPDDCRDGKPVLDSLHGTDVWREPSAYTSDLNAAMSLVPEGWGYMLCDPRDAKGSPWAKMFSPDAMQNHEARIAATPALALCAAALKARAGATL